MDALSADSLKAFVVEQCTAPYAYHPAAGADGTPGGCDRLAIDVDILQMLDAWPEGSALFDGSPLYEALDVLGGLIRGALGLGNTPLSVRPLHLPPTMHTPLSGTDVQMGQTVVLSGTIVRIFSKRVVPNRIHLRCPNCKTEICEGTDPFDRGAAVRRVCQGSRCKGQELVVANQEWMDYTECRLQPRMGGTEGRLPRSITVTLDNELAVKCSAGQLVEIIGVAKTRWKQVTAKAVPQVEVVVWAQNIVPRDDNGGRRLTVDPRRCDINPREFADLYTSHPNLMRTRLLMSTCPQLSGLAGPRLGILLSAIGGAEMKDDRTGHRVRGSVHCLLVGDPSTGKSQLLRFAAQLAPRSVITTGFTSSTAGLTAAATKEFGEWALEPGALVLSDGGTCVIDELRTVSNSDRTALHEAMEQQTISVAKAGLVTRLRTECTVVAACNPPMKRGSLASKGLTSELGIGGPLLSRFDFIFLLWDTSNDQHDEVVASHIVEVTGTEFTTPLSSEQLAKYLSFVRHRYARVGGPLLSDAAAKLIGRYYQHRRRLVSGHTYADDVPITIRFLEALVRVAQAHAKLLLRDVCEIDDAATAIFVMERTAHTTNMLLWRDEESGKDIRTSSSDLDSCFLGDDEGSLRIQSTIINIIVEVFSRGELGEDDLAAVTQHTLSAHGLSCEPGGKRALEEDIAVASHTLGAADEFSAMPRSVSAYNFNFDQPRGHSPYVPGQMPQGAPAGSSCADDLFASVQR